MLEFEPAPMSQYRSSMVCITINTSSFFEKDCVLRSPFRKTLVSENNPGVWDLDRRRRAGSKKSPEQATPNVTGADEKTVGTLQTEITLTLRPKVVLV